MSDTPRARALGKELRSARAESGLTMRQVGTLIGCSEAKVSRLETARRRLSPPTVRAFLDALDVRGGERDRLLRMAHDIDRTAWWESGGGLPAQLTELADAESRAVRITELSEVLIPGPADLERAGSGALPGAAGRGGAVPGGRRQVGDGRPVARGAQNGPAAERDAAGDAVLARRAHRAGRPVPAAGVRAEQAAGALGAAALRRIPRCSGRCHPVPARSLYAVPDRDEPGAFGRPRRGLCRCVRARGGHR